MYTNQGLAIVLAALMAMPALPAGPDLQIVVLDGRDAVHEVGGRLSTRTVVEVRDGSQRPVAGAEVTFDLPTQGAGGSFADGGHRYTTRTNLQGQAAIADFKPNSIQGTYRISVLASRAGQTATITIPQSNSTLRTVRVQEPAVKRNSRTKTVVLAAVSVAAAAGVAMALRRGGSKAPPDISGITITPGTIQVGGPR